MLALPLASRLLLRLGASVNIEIFEGLVIKEMTSGHTGTHDARLTLKMGPPMLRTS